ncbi:DNA-binding HxlR family transcriptional regulator [Rhizobium sp. SLBN-94]|nr:DNA-binding HxlR family transcriptional regulator [Rhizobium sp. SLBN-94]
MSATHMSVPNEPDASDCRALADILARVGDKWTVMVVGSLSQGPMRYNAMKRLIGGISQRMLTLTLRGLERDGLISRTVYPTVPAQVEYALTDLGRTLTLPLDTLLGWARVHRSAIAAHRDEFDRRA